MEGKINGIQQLGVGVENVQEAWKWYREHFSMDIRMFEEEATAELMLAHTEGKTRTRHAVLALNMQGGGGFEIWQHTDKKPSVIIDPIVFGDLGINIGVLISPCAVVTVPARALLPLSLCSSLKNMRQK